MSADTSSEEFNEATDFFGLPFDALGSAAPLLTTLRDKADLRAEGAARALGLVPTYMLRVGLKEQCALAFANWSDLAAVRSVTELLAAEVATTGSELAVLRGSADDMRELSRLADEAHKLWSAVEEIHAAELTEIRSLAAEACAARKQQQRSAVAERDPARRGIRHRIQVFRTDIGGIAELAQTEPAFAKRRWMQMRAGLSADPVLNERERSALVAEGEAIFATEANTAPLPESGSKPSVKK